MVNMEMPKMNKIQFTIYIAAKSGDFQQEEGSSPIRYSSLAI
jgi:hypothetical protein